MIDYSLILVTNYADKQWSLTGDSYDGLEWLDSSTKPTQSELDSQWNVIQAEIAANAYKAKRAAEYPPITDYLDGVVKGDIAQQEAYIAACLAVKLKYPKA
jgi:hypothetical protein